MTADSGPGAGRWAAIISAVTKPVSYFQPEVIVFYCEHDH